MTVRWSDPAGRDLLEITDSISDRDAASAARFLNEVDAVVRRLELFPHHGRRRPRSARDLRTLAFQRWVLVYEPREDAVVILRLLDGSRDIDRITAGME